MLTYSSLQHLGTVTEKSCNLSKYLVDLPREKESETSRSSSDEHLPK